MSGFVKAWPERLIKNKSQRYERPGTTTVKPGKDNGKIMFATTRFCCIEVRFHIFYSQ